MNIINVVHYLNHLHVIHLSEHIFKACGHWGSDKRGCTVEKNESETRYDTHPIMHIPSSSSLAGDNR